MLKKTIKYTDYNGVEREESYYFNLSEAELTEMEMTTAGGFVETIQAIVKAQDGPAIVKIFKELVLKAYGEKSADGRYFHKSDEISYQFSCSPAYSIIYMELATKADKASEFVNGIMPDNKKVEAAKSEHPALK